jgi:Tfp pilus assembly protein PilN
MIKINLLPKKARRDSLARDLTVFLTVLIIFLLGAGGLYYKNYREITQTKAEIERAKQEIARLDKIYKEFLRMEDEKKEIQRRIKAIESLKQNRALGPRLLYDLTTIVKDNVWLRGVGRRGGAFEIDGRSMENESISDLLETLSKVPYMSNVELKTVEDVVEHGVGVKRFIIQGNLTL